MKNKLQQIKEDSQAICAEASAELRSAGKNLHQIGDEYHRVTEVSRRPMAVLDDIDRQFKRATKLNNRDVAFLFLATALQCVRQYVLSNDALRITSGEGDKAAKKLLSGKIGGWQPVPAEPVNILTQSVPYDAVNFYSEEVQARLGNLGLGGRTHRYRTLGHDPVLGWVFGPVNIITNSLTRFDFHNFFVLDKKILGYYGGLYPGDITAMFHDAITFCQEDPMLIPTSVLRQAVHFGSDAFTNQGLPVPLISAVNNDLAKKMVTLWHIDTYSILRGAGLSSLINQLIACIHQLFYDPAVNGSTTLYEIKTRKILSYSNLMATGSNIIVTAITQDMQKLDVGGMLVTIHRLVDDAKFIHEVKKDFMKNELYDRIVGEQYDFMKGDF